MFELLALAQTYGIIYFLIPYFTSERIKKFPSSYPEVKYESKMKQRELE